MLKLEYLRRGLVFYRRWMSMVIVSTCLLGLVGYASDESIGLFSVYIVAVISLVTVFHAVFGSRSAFFNIVFANVITVYLCFFAFFVESIFGGLPWRYIAAGFLLPLLAFMAGALYRRREIREIIQSQKYIKEAEFLRSFLWLVPIALIGVFAFIVHQSRVNVPDPHLAAAFLGEMAAISIIVFFASRDFTLMMVDTGVISVKSRQQRAANQARQIGRAHV